VKELPTKTNVLIVGAGVSGYAAAISARREGKEVVLIDKNEKAGGAATYVNVGTIAGAYYRTLSSKPKLCGNKFSLDFFHDILGFSNEDVTVHNENGLYTIRYDWEALQNYLDDRLREEGVVFIPYCELIGVESINKTIISAELIIEGQSYKMAVDATIDCSGLAVVSELCGISMHQSERYQAAAQIFRLTNVKSESEFSLNLNFKKILLQTKENYRWPQGYLSLSIVPGSLRNGEVDLKLPLPNRIDDNPETIALTRSEALEDISRLFTILRENIKSLHEAKLNFIFPELGVRTQKRGKGIYTLCEKDILDSRKFNTGIAIGTWPMEEWTVDGRVKMTYFRENDAYEIPADCLESVDIQNFVFH